MLISSSTQKAVEYIKSNWKKGENLAEIAILFKIDPGNLTRAFRTSEGTTVKQFVDNNRKRYVLQKLTEDKHFGYQIGAELGFENDFSFYRWVRRAFGASFHELRENHNNK